MNEQKITIRLNGRDVALPEGCTIRQLLDERRLRERLVVVELNGSIVPRSTFGSTVLRAGDQVEIVHFVGGG